MCERDAPREIPSMQVRSENAAVSQMPKSQNENTVGDEKESSQNVLKQQIVSEAVTVHSSLAAISAVCDETTAMNQQTDHISSRPDPK